MHDSIPYDPIHGQGPDPRSRSRSRASEVPTIALFEVCLLRHLHWKLGNDH